MNPLDDIENIRSLKMVVKNGAVVSCAASSGCGIARKEEGPSYHPSATPSRRGSAPPWNTPESSSTWIP